ncbi:Protein argonaute-2 [Homalodisca vitripennis]|nr:Protein argonaute-2 [Homalodisca vitripennis]
MGIRTSSEQPENQVASAECVRLLRTVAADGKQLAENNQYFYGVPPPPTDKSGRGGKGKRQKMSKLSPGSGPPPVEIHKEGFWALICHVSLQEGDASSLPASPAKAGRAPSTPIVIPHSRLDLSIYPYTPTIATSIELPRSSSFAVSSVDSTEIYKPSRSKPFWPSVLNSELSAIRAACRSLQSDGSYKPSVTFLVVQKRHHTRFFPTRREDEDGKNKNVPPGTIVDTMITHPREMDFYLVSHASLQGTSRPTKYHKLWDDSNISEDDLEELTYYLCHLFTRCTRSVSYPAPTYYAHLAAARGRVYLEGQITCFRECGSVADRKRTRRPATILTDANQDEVRNVMVD